MPSTATASTWQDRPAAACSPVDLSPPASPSELRARLGTWKWIVHGHGLHIGNVQWRDSREARRTFFRRRSGALGLGHVGWGFLTSEGHYCFGSTENPFRRVRCRGRGPQRRVAGHELAARHARSEEAGTRRGARRTTTTSATTCRQCIHSRLRPWARASPTPATAPSACPGTTAPTRVRRLDGLRRHWAALTPAHPRPQCVVRRADLRVGPPRAALTGAPGREQTDQSLLDLHVATWRVPRRCQEGYQGSPGCEC